MQQFRPLPRFDMIEEAESVERPPAVTTDPIPTVHAAGPVPVIPARTTARVPIVLLGGSYSAPDTGQLAALTQKTVSTGKHSALTNSLRLPAGSPVRRVVIPAHSRRQRRTKPLRRLNPRLRQVIVLVLTLAIVLVTLTTLMPLSDSQGGGLFSTFGNWLHSMQMDWQIQAHQSGVNAPTALNGPGLPYMAIPQSQYVPVAEQDALQAGIPPVYFVRQINQESGFNPSAVSVTNAEGIAQFEPYTAAGLGIDPWDPLQALHAAAQLMARYYHQYGNYARALGAYNAGAGAVQSATNACGMDWLACMPGQTQSYVYRIMGV
ncbi:MAG TPA: transglycosylase SLT domain-containing protein [Ktedonobacteraceae bacterium]